MNTRTGSPRALVALVALLTVLAAGFLWWQSERSRTQLREQMLSQAEQRSLQLADAMGHQVARLLNVLDLELKGLRREWLRNPARFDEEARAVLDALPPGFVSHVSVIDAQGYMAYNSRGLQERMYVGDREHFQAQKRSGGDRLLVGKPVQSRLVNEWTIVVNRPLVREGRFDGTVQFIVVTDYLARELAALQLSPRDVVSLMHADGTFVARSRDNQSAMGNRVPGDRPFLDPAVSADHGIFRVHGMLDGTPRTYGWQRMEEYPMVVAIGLEDGSVLSALEPGFARGRAVTGALTLLLVACGGLIVVLLLRSARREATANAREAFRRRLFDSSYVPTVVMDRETFRMIDCNPAAQRIYGYASREEVLGKLPIDVSAPRQYDGSASLDKSREYVERAHAEGSLVFEWLHQRPDGTQWDGECHLMGFESEGRSLMQFTLQDITARKRTEAALRESEARLQEAQRLARIGNWQLDLTSHQLTWSDEIFRIFELDPATVTPTYKRFILAVHPDDRDLVHEMYRSSVDTRQPYEAAHRLLMPDGRVKYVLESGFTQYEGDQPVHSVGTVQDITEVRMAEEALRRLNEELEVRVAERTRELSMLNRELEAFAYSVAHDLRTPLRTIDGFAQLLDEDCGDSLSPQGRGYLRRILVAVQRMGRLTSDLLTLAHLSRAELHREPVDLSAMARVVADELVRSDPSRQVAWHIDDGMRVTADPGLMRVVLENLLGNAWKYTGLTANARISLTGTAHANGTVEFCVRDNGAGFDMTYASQLFEPFKRLHRQQEFEGTGVGLATVHRVIERHGGWVRGEGAVGQGAAFYFSVPGAVAGGR
jgi:PAS domain S-box-containing protein